MHLITRFLHGGSELTTEHAIDALLDAPEPYELQLGVGTAYDANRLESVADRGVATRVFHTIRHYNPITAVAAVAEVAHHLRHEDIDVLHTHSTEAGVIGRVAGTVAGTPVMVHEIHGDPVTEDRNPLLNLFVTAAERAVAPLTTRFVVKSDRIREAYLGRGIGRPEQYELVYHGVPLEEYRVERDRSTGDGPVTLLYVGRVVEGKGLFDLIRAIEQLPGEHDVRLRVAGDGPLRDDLQTEVSERGLGGTVELLGYRDDVPALLAQADVFVLPSYREGTPRVITEARAAGLPVVASDVAGIPEMVDDGKNGYLVAPGDVDALVDRLSRLIEDPVHRREMGDRARDGLERFSLERSRERYRELYRELTRDVRPRGE